MSEVEPVLSHPLFQLIFSGLLFFIQLSVVLYIYPIKKSIERTEKTDEKQWDAIGEIEKQLSTLQGEHNARHTGDKKN